MTRQDKTNGTLTRRDSFKLGALGAAAAILPSTAPRRAAATGGVAVSRADGGDKPRNIIYMVSDGMGMGTLSLAETLSRIARGPKQGTHWAALLKDRQAVHGQMETHSLDSIVTDSAAAAASWGSGSRVANGALNMLPDGTKLTSIAELAQDAGRRVALVTTTEMTHATPAGFAVQVPRRQLLDQIAPQYLDRVDVLMGGGTSRFSDELVERYKQRGYTHWTHRRDIMGDDKPQRVLGLFNSGHLPFTLERDQSSRLQERVPTLAEMTAKALTILEDTPNGFLMQVEGGRVDQAAHANDATSMIWDQIAFDDAIGVALEFARRRGDTLVVITTDHDTGNPSLNGLGSNYSESTGAFESIVNVKASYGQLIQAMRRAADDRVTADIVTDVIREHTGIALNQRHADAVARSFHGDHDPLNVAHRNFNGTLGLVLANHIGVGFTGTRHTSALVCLTAFGPGSERFFGLQPNTDSFRHMTALMDIEHTNPSMTPEQAWRLARLQPRIEVPMM